MSSITRMNYGLAVVIPYTQVPVMYMACEDSDCRGIYEETTVTQGRPPESNVHYRPFCGFCGGPKIRRTKTTYRRTLPSGIRESLRRRLQQLRLPHGATPTYVYEETDNRGTILFIYLDLCPAAGEDGGSRDYCDMGFFVMGPDPESLNRKSLEVVAAVKPAVIEHLLAEGVQKVEGITFELGVCVAVDSD